MQSQPGVESAAKARRKPKTADPATAPASKTSRSRKKTASSARSDTEVLAFHPSPAEISGMIATAAYYFAAERNFAAGHELEDWLRAEALIHGQLSR